MTNAEVMEGNTELLPEVHHYLLTKEKNVPDSDNTY